MNIIGYHFVYKFAWLALPVIFLERIFLFFLCFINLLLPVLQCQDILWLFQFISLKIFHEFKIAFALLIVFDELACCTLWKVIRSLTYFTNPNHNVWDWWRILLHLFRRFCLRLLISRFSSWFQGLPILCLILAQLLNRDLLVHLLWYFISKFFKIFDCSIYFRLRYYEILIVVVICGVTTRAILLMKHYWILAIPAAKHVYLFFQILLLYAVQLGCFIVLFLALWRVSILLLRALVIIGCRILLWASRLLLRALRVHCLIKLHLIIMLLLEFLNLHL